MKKTLLTLFFGLAALAGMAQTTTNYNEKLIVTINDVSTDSIPAAITVVHNTDGTINFSLKNFMLVDGEESMPVGNIDLNNVTVEQKDGYEAISTEQTITIAEGDDTDVDFWMGPMIGEVPIKLQGKLAVDHMYVTIDIDMQETLEQIIGVTVGQDKGFDAQSSDDKTETGIATATTGKQGAPSAIYTLDGRRVSRAAKGFYIVGGKKVIK